MNRFPIALIALWILVGAASARAQSSENTALAEQLFNQGRELARANDWAAACPKFEASLRYDATLGTRLNLATCYEKVGRIASAWGHYRDAAELAGRIGDTRRRDYALNQAAALEPRLPRLTIRVPDRRPAKLSVTRDGVVIDAAAFGTALYVDPGAHAIEASAPGFASVTISVTVAESRAETVAIPQLSPRPEPPAASSARPVAPAPAVRLAAPGSSRWRYAGMAITAGGALALGAGLVVGAKARSTYGDVKTLCGADLVCDSQPDYDRGHALVGEARSQATISTVLVAAGGAAIAAGVIVWLAAPGPRRTETARVVPVLDPHGIGLGVVGRF